MTEVLTLIPLRGIPLIVPGDDLARILADALEENGVSAKDGDILVVAQKIVSKAEDRYVVLDDVSPSPQAQTLAEVCGKDPRIVESILNETDEIVRARGEVLIVAHKRGFVMANAGIDESNIEHTTGSGRILLLPEDPDRSASHLKQALEQKTSATLGVIIADSFGRPWRNGVVGVAIGCAGLPALIDRIGAPDLYGRKLKITEIAAADQLAAAASLIMGEADEAIPAVLVRGFSSAAPHRPASALIRDKSRDMFR